MINLYRRAQGAIEFMIIFGAILFFFVIFFGVIQANISDKEKEKQKIVAQNVALDVQDEINLAGGASDGYSRTFTIPADILGNYYSINLTQQDVYLEMDGYGVAYRITNVSGSLIKGSNLIRKENGKVYLN